MQRCKELAELYGAYIYGDTASDETLKVREHLAVCEKCRADVELRQKVIRVIPNVLPRMSPKDRQRVAWAVKAGIRQEKGGGTWWQAAAPFAHSLSLAAVIVVVFAGGTLFGLRLRENLVSTSIPPPRQEKVPPALKMSPNPEPVQRSPEPSFLQPPPAVNADPFLRSLNTSAASRSGADWRLGWPGSSWRLPDHETDNARDSESSADKTDENQPTEDRGAAGQASQTSGSTDPAIPRYPWETPSPSSSGTAETPTNADSSSASEDSSTDGQPTSDKDPAQSDGESDNRR